MTTPAPGYVPLDRTGVIGDLNTAALIDDTGAVTWLCLPNFDSPSLFASLLDQGNGGLWRIAPAGGGAGKQRYIVDTNVLVTTHVLEGGVTVEVTDFMPVAAARTRFPELHRMVRCRGGDADVVIRFDPRFDYATRPARWQQRGHGWLAVDDEDDVVTLVSSSAVEWTVGDTGLTGRLTMHDGERASFVMRFDDDEVLGHAAYDTAGKFEATVDWWTAWAERARYAGPYARAVRRSLLTLKLCCFEPTGAVVAAPTTSLPETPGGERNWDYRFMWLRDSAFVLYALDRSGYSEEVDAFTHFVKRLCRRVDGPHVQTMYRIDGSRNLEEAELPHLEGYGGARPVRVGNAAAHQYQMDVYGELLEMVYVRHRHSPPTEGLWNALRLLVEWTARNWRTPDWSIWEARQEPRDFVFSKIMAWVALDRGSRMAADMGHVADATRWRAESDAVHADVMARGWDEERGTLVQAYGSPDLDAAVLVAPKVGFFDRSDPRTRRMVEAVRRELGTPHAELIYRYRSHDGLAGTEGAFIICSFWLAQALALIGDVDAAEDLFRRLLARATPLGLYAEEIDPATGAHLGNFPQAFSHAALINTAHILAAARRRGRAARLKASGAGARPDGAPAADATAPSPPALRVVGRDPRSAPPVAETGC